MTKKELIEMLGTNEDADFVIEAVLNQIKPDFIKSALKCKLKAIDEEIEQMTEAGVIYKLNGMNHIAWSTAMELNFWDMTEEQEKAYEAAYDKCAVAEALLYSRNRTQAMLLKI